jgi:hypothetical protein
MPGPYSSDHDAGSDGPPIADAHAGEPIPAAPGFPLPPPLPYPQPRRRRRLLLGGAVLLLVVAALTAAILHTSHRVPTATAGVFSEAMATSAIQNYLNALQNRDTETIARNAMCGIYDAVRDRRSDQAVAALSSDAFRNQFSQAQVTSVDKIVYWSAYQAQVLFSMRVQPATGSSTRSEVQGVAQLLSQRNQVLVCSYVLRAAGLY